MKSPLGLLLRLRAIEAQCHYFEKRSPQRLPQADAGNTFSHCRLIVTGYDPACDYKLRDFVPVVKELYE